MKTLLFFIFIFFVVRYFIKRNKLRSYAYYGMDYYEVGVQLLEQRKYREAIDFFSKVIKTNPNDEEAYNNRGTCRLRLKNYRKAISDFSYVIAINPNKASSYSNRSACYASLGDYSKALSDDNAAVEIEPDNPINLNNRGYTYLELKEYEKAIEDFTAAIKLKPGYSTAYHNRGLAFYALKIYKKAIGDFNKVITINPNDEVYKNRGNAYFELGEFRKALEDWEEAIRHNSKLRKGLRDQIEEAKKKHGIQSEEDSEKLFEMSHLYDRLNYLLKNSTDGTINFKHDIYDSLQLMKMADILNETYTKQKTQISPTEIKEILMKVKKSDRTLDDNMLNEMVKILMGG